MTSSNAGFVSALPPPPPPPPAVRHSQQPPSSSSSPPAVRARLSGDPHDVAALVYQVKQISAGSSCRLPHTYLSYIDVTPALQKGPSCGLTALSVIANIVQPTSVSDLLVEAQLRGFTKQGEMFNAQHMCSLAQSVLGEHCDVRLHSDNYLTNEQDDVWDNVQRNVIYLIPYDKDKDYRPGLLRGHHAHWAMIIGFCEPTTANVKFYCAVQSKSLKVSLWRPDWLSASNSQLDEVAAHLNHEEYVIGDIRKDLSGRCISFTFKEHVKLRVVTCADVEREAQEALSRIVGLCDSLSM